MRPNRLLLAATIVATVSLVACSHVPWGGKYVAGPLKRRHASEERARRAIDAYFAAAIDLIGLHETQVHGECLEAYWMKGEMTRARRQRIDADTVCAYMLKRYDEAVSDLAGYGQAPSGKYPWLGEVFEYVVRAETVETKDQKMAEIDRYVVAKFDDLLRTHPSPIIPNVANDYYVVRGTCCRDVTVFDDWYRTRLERRSAK